MIRYSYTPYKICEFEELFTWKIHYIDKSDVGGFSNSRFYDYESINMFKYLIIEMDLCSDWIYLDKLPNREFYL